MALNKIPLSSLSTALKEHISVFICSASFEDRSTVIASHLDRNRVDHAIICANQVAFTPFINERAQRLLELFGARGIVAEISIENPLTIADRIQQQLRALPKHPVATYVVDITSFTHEALLILLRVLQAHVNPSDKLICIYNAASDYAIGSAPEDKWLTKGVGEIRSVLGYPGRIIPTQKIHLIVLVGFEMERAEKIIAAYEPNQLSLGYGSPLESISLPFHDLNRQFHRRLSQKYKKVSEFAFSCEDPFAAKIAIDKQAAMFPGLNVFVAPMNTKISTVGVALAAFQNEAIQVCYATAEQYNLEGYSVPSGECYLFEIPFASPAVA